MVQSRVERGATRRLARQRFFAIAATVAIVAAAVGALVVYAQAAPAQEGIVASAEPTLPYTTADRGRSAARTESASLTASGSVDGNTLVEVPDVVGRTGAGAASLLVAAGLTLFSTPEAAGTLYTDPYSVFGALSSEMWRAVRLVVDTGLHAKGWTREQAIDYFRANTPLGDADTVAVVDRCIAVPGQALADKVGQLKIQELRNRAQQTLGPRFDIRAFHAQVVGGGSLPLAMLEAKIDRWLSSLSRPAGEG